MRRFVAGFTFMAISIAAVATGTALADPSGSARGELKMTNGPSGLAPHVPGEVLVRYKKGVQGGQRAAVRSVAAARVKTDISEFRTQLLELPAHASMRAIAGSSVARVPASAGRIGA